MLNVEKLFKAAADAGISVFEARITSDSRLTVAMFNRERENFSVADDGSLKVRGIVDGKSGVFSSDRTDDGVIDMAVAAVKESAEYGNPVDPAFFIDGGKYKYQKVNTYHENLAKATAEDFTALAQKLADKILDTDKRIELANVQVEYVKTTERLINSNGLDVQSAVNFAMVFASVKATENGEVQSGSHYEILTDLGDLDADKFVKTLTDNALNMLGAGGVETGKYPVVYSPDCVAVFVRTLCAGFSAFAVEQHISLIEGKVGEQVFSPSFGIENSPIGDDVFCSAYDAEGVPCKNFMLVDKGVPTGYVYDLDTAKRAQKESTGNGKLTGGNVRPDVGFVTVKAGDATREQMFEKVGDGVYINDLGGVSTGIDGQSGNYSLQASGYRIRNGKLAEPLSLFTVAGNIMTDFADIVAVGNDSKLTYYEVKAPSVAIGGLNVSGVGK